MGGINSGRKRKYKTPKEAQEAIKASKRKHWDKKYASQNRLLNEVAKVVQKNSESIKEAMGRIDKVENEITKMKWREYNGELDKKKPELKKQAAVNPPSNQSKTQEGSDGGAPLAENKEVAK
ncbi:MAG: hypothetical protein LBC87_07410 [Fibromonadaceae bacterium]|jgi:predicted transcriptional regulator|nr:hypothetical protein [Fibromonadaceae bacterium]